MDTRPTFFVVAGAFSARECLRSLLEGTGVPVEAFHSPQSFVDRCLRGARGWLVVPADGVLSGAAVQLYVAELDGKGGLLTPTRSLTGETTDLVSSPLSVATVERLCSAQVERSGLAAMVGAASGSTSEGYTRLTRREREVLHLVTDGKTSKDIALHLTISLKTVEKHRAKVMEKMGAKNAADLVRRVLSPTKIARDSASERAIERN